MLPHKKAFGIRSLKWVVFSNEAFNELVSWKDLPRLKFDFEIWPSTSGLLVMVAIDAEILYGGGIFFMVVASSLMSTFLIGSRYNPHPIASSLESRVAFNLLCYIVKGNLWFFKNGCYEPWHNQSRKF